MTNTPAFDVVLALLNSGQITHEQIDALRAAAPSRASRTHGEHFDHALHECPPASLSTYKTNFRRLSERFGDKALCEVSTAELEALANEIREQCIRDGGIGIGAQTSFVHGARFYYRIAVKDGVLDINPAAALVLPRKRRRVRRALTEVELTEIYQIVLETSQDALLDLMLLDFHRETAARRGGAVALRLADINLPRMSVLLREKGGHEREVPVSVALLERMMQTAARRGARRPGDAVFRYRNGDPLTRRRYNTIFKHVQQNLDWALRLGVTVHWFRHTTLSDVAAATGVRVAAAYAGHVERSVTDIYTVPTFEQLAEAHRLIFPDA